MNVRVVVSAAAGIVGGGVALGVAHHLADGRREDALANVLGTPPGDRFPREADGRRITVDPYPTDGVPQDHTQPSSTLFHGKSKLELLAQGSSQWTSVASGVGGVLVATALGAGAHQLAKSIGGTRPGLAGAVTTVGIGAAAAVLGAGAGGAIGTVLGQRSFQARNAMTPEAIGVELVGLYDHDKDGSLNVAAGSATETPFGSLRYISQKSLFDQNASPYINEFSRGVDKLDGNGDGKLTVAEVASQAKGFDENGDGVLNSGEAKSFAEARGLAYWDVPRQLK